MLRIAHLNARYAGRPALQDISLQLDKGELLVAFGPSGCSKTTLLNLITGFLPVESGSITLEGKTISGPGAERGVVFPFGALCAFTREQMQTLLLMLWRDSGKQIFLITHDIKKAVFRASERVLLPPGPGRIVERLKLNFGQRFADGEPYLAIKSDPAFIEQSEYVLSRVFEQREAFV